MFVIGTAGHVDHGKSTLIEAITGIDPDRLREEKERGMTIELGFAWMTLPGGHEVSIVDVPGHERFIKNMLMGVGGIDMALLIVAADEGVMPQTREHLAILDLLQIERGLVAITKRELVDDDWLELIAADVEDLLDGTSLEGAQAVPVSAFTGDGLPELLVAAEEILSDIPEKRDLGRPRLPVDRAFTISGFGTVVTGTLTDGSIRAGQEVEILPSGAKARIRGLQTHKEAEDDARPGTRVAINLSGISHDQINRGDVITVPGWLKPTDVLDVSLRIIEGAPRPVKHNAAATLFTGSAEAPARVRLLAANELKPGETGWAQIKLAYPVTIVKGDYFVIRDTATTLGGGVAVDPYPKRHKRFDEATLTRLETLARGSDEDILISALQSNEPGRISDIARAANQSDAAVAGQIETLIASGGVVSLSGDPSGLLYSAEGWAKVASSARAGLQEFHSQFPLRSGMPREELRSRLGMKAADFTPALARLETESVIETDEALARLPGFTPEFTDEQNRQIDEYLKLLGSDKFSPPTDRPIDAELIAALDDQQRVVRANEDVIFLKSAYDEMAERVVQLGKAKGEISLGEVREMFSTSRKYTLALLEHMDRLQITRRVGDDRVLR